MKTNISFGNTPQESYIDKSVPATVNENLRAGYVMFLESKRTGKEIRIGLYKTTLECYKAFEKLQEKGYIFKRIQHCNEFELNEPPQYVRDKYNQAIELINQGYSVKRAAQTIGVDYRSLMRYIEKKQGTA